MLSFAAIFSASICQDSIQFHALLVKPWHDPVIQNICRCDGGFVRIELGKSNPAVGIDESLLVNITNALDFPHIINVLRPQKAGMQRFDLAMSFLFDLGFFKGCQLL